MDLKEQLRHDLTAAMRARDTRRKSVLRMVLSAIQLAEVEKKGDLSDEDVIVVIRKEVRRREDALKMIRQAGRTAMVADEETELEILRAYLPQLMDADAVRSLAQRVISEVQATSLADFGKVMKVLMPQARGKADGRMVSETVRALLSA